MVSFTTILALATSVLASTAVPRSNSWEIVLFEKGGCSGTHTTKSGTAGTGCINIGFKAASGLWTGSSSWKALLYQDANCPSGAHNEEFTSADSDMCYTTGLYSSGPGYSQSYKIVAA